MRVSPLVHEDGEARCSTSSSVTRYCVDVGVEAQDSDGDACTMRKAPPGNVAGRGILHRRAVARDYQR